MDIPKAQIEQGVCTIIFNRDFSFENIAGLEQLVTKYKKADKFLIDISDIKTVDAVNVSFLGALLEIRTIVSQREEIYLVNVPEEIKSQLTRLCLDKLFKGISD